MRETSCLGCLGFVLLAWAACSSEPPRPNNPSCASLGSCFDYTGASWRTGTTAQQACAAAMGTFSGTQGCAPKDRFGSCTLDGGKPTEYAIRYYPPLTEAAARQICSSYNGQYGP